MAKRKESMSGHLILYISVCIFDADTQSEPSQPFLIA